MDRWIENTRLGPVLLRGEKVAAADARPIVLAICGAFALEDTFEALQRHVPEAQVLVVHLPGPHAPQLAATSIGAFSAAFSEVAVGLRRPILVCGASMGGLVAMAMSASNIKALVLLDPPLRTSKLWPLIEPMQAGLRESDVDPARRDFLANVFGYTADQVVERDYTHLVERVRVRTVAILGELPLYPERQWLAMPSLVDEPERVLLASNRCVRVVVARGAGHNLPANAGALVVTHIRNFLALPELTSAAPEAAKAPDA